LHSGSGNRPMTQLSLPKSELTPKSEPSGKWLFFSMGGKLGYL